jgi:flagellar biosynthesis/type III secretory pathway protein FliH
MATIVKAASLGPALSRRIPGVLLEAEVEARRRLASADEQARALVERARGEAEALLAEARRRGREEGLATAAEVVVRATAERDRLLSSAEGELVDLAFEIARRVLASAAERGAVAEVAARALDAARMRERVALRAHPADLEALRSAEPDLLARLVHARGLALRPDETIARGGVVVETEAGRIDGRLETQLAALRGALDEVTP